MVGTKLELSAHCRATSIPTPPIPSNLILKGKVSLLSCLLKAVFQAAAQRTASSHTCTPYGSKHVEAHLPFRIRPRLQLLVEQGGSVYKSPGAAT